MAKFNETFKKKKGVYIASKGSASGAFAIQHYAGKVIISLRSNRVVLNI